MESIDQDWNAFVNRNPENSWFLHSEGNMSSVANLTTNMQQMSAATSEL